MRRNLDLEHCPNFIAAYVKELEENDRKIAEGASATTLALSRITFWYPILTRYCPNHPVTQHLKRERDNMKRRKDLGHRVLVR